MRDGPQRYTSVGIGKSKGTKVFALAGRVVNTGLVEVPMGMSLREIIFDIGGGIMSRGRGCVRCRGTGYRGREGVFEILPFTEPMKSITTEHAELSAIQALARKEGMVTLRENALLKLLEGKTTYQEVLRVTWGEAL